MSCEICPIITGPSEEELSLRLYEGTFWRATLRASDQSLLGTSFITAKRHVEALPELSPDEQREFFYVQAMLEHGIKQAFGAQVINTSCLMNLAFDDTTNDPQPHVHWHIKPRYRGEVIFDNISFRDPDFGAYLSGLHKRHPVSIVTARNIVQAIKNNFSNI